MSFSKDLNQSESNNFFDNSISKTGDFYQGLKDSANTEDSSINQSLEQNHENKYKYKLLLICRTCYKMPTIIFNDNYTLNITCDCQSIENANYDYFMENFTVKEKITVIKTFENKILNRFYCKCDEHYHKEYVSSCLFCNRNLCYDCFSKNTNHKTHGLDYFHSPENIQKLKKIIEFFKNESDKNLKKNIDFKILKEKAFRIIRLIVISFLENPCLESLTNIKNSFDFIMNQKKDMKIMKNIKAKRLDLEITKEKEQIHSIRINQSNFNDLTYFTNAKLINLKILTLSNNNLVNIKPLATVEAPNLSHLNLSMNLITDEYSEYIDKIVLNFENLKNLNLYMNLFHKYSIFKSFNHHKNFKTLFIGQNKMIKDKKDYTIKYEMPSVEEIGLGGGVFSDSSIDLLSNFIFTNLKIIYLSGNCLKSLKFVESMNCENLEEFWAVRNLITDFSPLVKFMKLKMINLSNNPISDITQLNYFITNFIKLEKISFENTNIDKNDENNKKIIEEARKKIVFKY